MKLLIVDQIRLMAELVAIGLKDEEDVEETWIATGKEEALTLLSENDIDVVLASVDLPDGNTLKLIRCVRDDFPEVKSVAVGIEDQKSIILEYIQAGAASYVFCDESAETMIDYVRAAYASRALVSPEMASAMMNRLAALSTRLADIDVDPSVINELTKREKEALHLVAQGLTNHEIGEEMTIETGTVKNHVHSILNKLRVNSREDASAYFHLLQKTDQIEPSKNGSSPPGSSSSKAI